LFSLLRAARQETALFDRVDSLLGFVLDYLWIIGLLGGASGAAGVIANVTHAV
jgi:hypothetical protein